MLLSILRNKYELSSFSPFLSVYDRDGNMKVIKVIRIVLQNHVNNVPSLKVDFYRSFTKK